MARKSELCKIGSFREDGDFHHEININTINDVEVFPVRTLLQLGEGFFDRRTNKNLVQGSVPAFSQEIECKYTNLCRLQLQRELVIH